MNADDRLSLASLGRVEGGDGIVESRDVADVRPQSTMPHPLDDLTQLGAIGYDDEVDSQAARGPRLHPLSQDGYRTETDRSKSWPRPPRCEMRSTRGVPALDKRLSGSYFLF